MSRSVRHARCERSAHCLRDFLKRRTTHSSPQRRCVQSRADRGAATSGGQVCAISVRSACSSIGWSSSVVLSCWGDSHRAIDERSRRVHPIVSFDKRFVWFTHFQISNRDSSEFYGVLCVVLVGMMPAQGRRALRGSGARSATSPGAGRWRGPVAPLSSHSHIKEKKRALGRGTPRTGRPIYFGAGGA